MGDKGGSPPPAGIAWPHTPTSAAPELSLSPTFHSSGLDFAPQTLATSQCRAREHPHPELSVSEDNPQSAQPTHTPSAVILIPAGVTFSGLFILKAITQEVAEWRKWTGMGVAGMGTGCTPGEVQTHQEGHRALSLEPDPSAQTEPQNRN